MSEMSTGWYEIRLKGHLDARWSVWFDGLALSNESDGTTVIQGPVIDQAALHGLLQKTQIKAKQPGIPAEPRQPVKTPRRPT